MAKFMYLFRNNSGAYQTISPEQMQQTVEKWMRWRDILEKDNHIHQLGERLDVTGKVISGKSKAISDGPYVEVKDFIQGYLIVNALDMEQALELAKGCPVLDSDGSVEVRPFFTME
jgi:hypothetical protein